MRESVRACVRWRASVNLGVFQSTSKNGTWQYRIHLLPLPRLTCGRHSRSFLLQIRITTALGTTAAESMRSAAWNGGGSASLDI